ncbi:MAG: hypothetical protein EXS60_01145 [Candidatus Pacebacteria bacterium]|nr:hypothetical protein [Candidatus Paceibacterota bacterium]
MLRPRKKKKNWLRCIFSFAVLAFLIFTGVRFHAQIVRFVESAWLVVKKPDIASVLHAVHREDFGMLCVKDVTGADSCYVFDKEGVIFQAANLVVGSVIARVDDASDFKPTLGVMLADPEVWANIAPIVAYVKESLPASRMEFVRAERELTVTLSDNGTKFYFSLQFSPSEHIRALKELSKTVSIETLQYADLRVKGRVFYK